MPEQSSAAAWVAEHRDRLVEDLAACCRIPSVAVDGGDEMARMADWLTERLQPLLDVVEQVPVTGAPPAVVGRARGAASASVLLYSHYDVQPSGPPEAWSVPPFAARPRDGRLVARGVADDKADVMARVHALEALRATGRPLPCTVVWLSEGAEEIGSVGLADLLRTERERLIADACLWESYLLRDDGRPEIGFGCRGLLYLSLTLRTLRSDQHSAFAGVFRSAPLELARALATLAGPDGRPTVDGLAERAAAFDDAELEAAAGIPVPSAAHVALDGHDPYVARPAAELGRRLVTEATVNVTGIVAGHADAGTMTIVPAEARAKVDLRLLPGQTDEDTVALLRAHLDRRGFADVEIDVLHSIPAARSPIDFPLAAAVTQAARELHGEPIRYPLVPGGGPMHLVEQSLGIPTVLPPGSTRMGSGIHGPDEHVEIDDYLAHVAFTIRTLELLGERSGRHPAGGEQDG